MKETLHASKRQLTLLRKLHKKKYRDELMLFIAEGERSVEQILSNNIVRVEECFIDKSVFLPQSLLQLLQEQEVSLSKLDSQEFKEISDTENPQGILAICHKPKDTSLIDFQSLPGGCLLAIDRIQDPGNLGTIVRTAAWFGIKGLLISKGSVDLYHPKVVRSTAGATGSIPAVTGELTQMTADMERKGWQVGLLDVGEDSINLTDFIPNPKIILVVGNEANGIDPGLKTNNRKSIKIPGEIYDGNVESLNAAIAAGIAIYDITGKLINH